MCPFLEWLDALFVGSQQRERNLHGIPEVNLAQISHMTFGGEGRAVALLHIGRPDAELQPQLVDRAVHHHVVIGHVEMAVIVDPLWLDLHHRGHEWGGRQLRFPGGGRGRHRLSLAAIWFLTPYISFATVAQSREEIDVATTITSTLKRPEPQALKSAVDALAARCGNRLINSQAVR